MKVENWKSNLKSFLYGGLFVALVGNLVWGVVGYAQPDPTKLLPCKQNCCTKWQMIEKPNGSFYIFNSETGYYNQIN